MPMPDPTPDGYLKPWLPANRQTMRPEDVPDQLVDILGERIHDDWHEDCEEAGCHGATRAQADEVAREYLAAVLPAHEAAVRAKAAEELRRDAIAHRATADRRAGDRRETLYDRASVLNSAAARITRGEA